jgi:Zn-dependent M28 family amino/carboxypeptidase
MPPARSDQALNESAGSDLAARLFAHVDTLAGLIGPRDLGHKSAFDAAASYIEREFQRQNDTVERERYDAGPHTVSNLVMTRPGTTRADEIVLLGAHYDTVSSTPGADDNASAVAVLIEAARILQSAPSARTVRFVAFACEEPPHFYTETMGSQFHARASRSRNEKIIGMLCLEMVGYYTSEKYSRQSLEMLPRVLRWAVPSRGDFLAAVANLRSWRLLWNFRRGFKRATQFPLFSIALPERINLIRLSDNSSFWDQGYPALMLTDTSFLRNPHYHEPTDTPETLDYPRMAQVTQGVAGALRRLAHYAPL